VKSTRLLAAAALIGAVSCVLPPHAFGEHNSIVGAKQTYEGAEAEGQDAGITSRIRTALAINPITKEATIHVNTKKGIVNLTGDVRDASVMQAAQEIAQNAGHVKGVCNNLKVENVSNASYEM
jgi:osmotically-inducible protein OsmY